MYNLNILERFGNTKGHQGMLLKSAS
uniref:Uncharacterized protein n=1 Tax=Anguilla anguilla TaxID=7936 RepID=A0A0E9PJP1_ANGAN